MNKIANAKFCVLILKDLNFREGSCVSLKAQNKATGQKWSALVCQLTHGTLLLFDKYAIIYSNTYSGL